MELYSTLLIGTFLVVLGGALAQDTKGRGLGEQYDWVTFEDGLKLAKENNKPMMLVIHKTWCGACKALKPKFAASEEILKLSSDFVMVNVEDDEEPEGSQFQPDGGYIPRILFLNSDGVVQPDLINTLGNPQYKYFYSNALMVTEAMKSAVKALGGSRNDEL
ncbi:thioredoxin domain-containing protein 12-like [Strongylocentrotus purpuratus]|uniref:Thioredoxin domain-containing protein 12 n=3 Tax=Strongylocentrotus purpuratus TaxID=7668 RepID=A0A7M7PJB1_STRPU|nr:thioredoxin domain-containing protein 12-like [Strongylocentrotus purpuratus]|eukprot:XP_791682.2 PREDICTED: thioredoxin domain-containing protein 12 [Strongylocentrotus purpuratus]